MDSMQNIRRTYESPNLRKSVRIFIFLLLVLTVVSGSMYGADAAHQDLETKRSSLEGMVAEENNVYSIWRPQTGNNFEILFRASNDSGETFENVISLTEIKDRVPDGFLTAKGHLVYAFLEGEIDNKPVIYFNKSIDEENYTVTLQFNPTDTMNMMN